MTAAAQTKPTPKRAAVDRLEMKDLTTAINLMPHDLHIYDSKKETVVFTTKRSGKVARLIDVPPRECIVEVDGVSITVRLGAPTFSGVTPELPDAPIIVSDLVARYVIDQDTFPHAVWSPDTNPRSVVRDEEGGIKGTTCMVFHNGTNFVT